MNATDPQQEMRDAARLGELLRDQVDGHVSRDTDARSFASVFDQLQTPTATAPPRPRWPRVLALAACALLVAGALLWWSRSDAPIAPQPNIEQLATATTDHTLSLDGGGSLHLDPASLATLEQRGVTKGTVSLQRGQVRLEIPHRTETQWDVYADGWRVKVVGTTFSVNLRDGDLKVSVSEGLVEVVNPSGSETWRVGAGASLVRPSGQAPRLLTASPEVPLSPTPKASPHEPPPDASTKPSPPKVTPPKARRPSFSAWPELVDGGDYASVISQARKAGLRRAYKAARRRELRALIDAARYLGRADIEHAALLAMRKRFIKKAEGREAAFLLGRLLEKQNKRPDALRWYQRYTREAPNGAFADEALGRSVMVLRALGRAEQAREAANTYLQRFPRGSYRRAASRVTASPP